MDGTVVEFDTEEAGDNGLLPVNVGESDATLVCVIFPVSGSIAYFNYYSCADDTTPAPTQPGTPGGPTPSTPVPTPSLPPDSGPSPSEITCLDGLEEDFETPDQAESWTNGVGSVTDDFTGFLGPLLGDPSLPTVSKAFSVPSVATSLTLMFDFYNIDGTSTTKLFMFTQGSKVLLKPYQHPGTIRYIQDESVTGTNDRDDAISVEFVNDGQNTIKYTITIPAAWYDSYGYVLPIEFDVAGTMSNEGYGIDNIVWTATCVDATDSPTSGPQPPTTVTPSPVAPAVTPSPVAPATPTVSPVDGTVAPTAADYECVAQRLDFDTLAAGEYVTDQFLSEHGVTISAASDTGYVPDGAARAFDTANPGTEEDGDPDLGSPNEACPGGGPGVGDGGGPDQTFPNCEPQGIVLIIQESNKTTPDDNVAGGTIFFDFVPPSNVFEIGILDIDGDVPSIKVSGVL